MNELVSPLQSRLLQATLLDREPALIAWQQWQAHANLDQLEPGAYLIMPLLYHNLEQSAQWGVSQHPWLPRLKGIYRRTWYANQLALSELTALLHALHNANIQATLLGTAATIAQFYHDLGLRPVEAWEIGVPPVHAEAAIGILQDFNYTPQPPTSVQDERYRRWASSARFRSPRGHWFSLHWHWPVECPTPSTDQVLWTHVVPVTVGETSVNVPDAASQFWLICRPCPPAMRAAQLADAYTILHSTPAMDWDGVLELTRQLGGAWMVQAVLAALQAVLDVPVPAWASDRLAAVPVSAHEHAAFQATGLWSKITGYRQRFECIQKCNGQRRSYSSFIEFLQYTWGLAHPWQVPGAAVVRLVRFFKP